MDFYEPIDPEDLASDPFDEDDHQSNQDYESPRPASDYSVWPSESLSPAPQSSQHDDDHEPPRHRHAYYYDDDQEIETDDDEFEYVFEEEDLNDASNDEHDSESGSDPVSDNQSDLFSENDLDNNSDNMSLHSHPAPSNGSQRDVSEAPSDGLFVDQHPPRLPPIDDFFPEFRQRALAAVADLHAITRSIQENRRRSRHHPYNLSADFPRDRRRMADRRANRSSRGPRDELIAVEVQQARRNGTPGHAHPEVIDLTGEPDSPEEVRAVPPPRARSLRPPRNANRNAPRQDADVIDLTLDDSPAPPPRPQRLPPIVPPPLPNPLNMPRAEFIDLENDDELGARLYGMISHFARPGMDLINRIGNAFGQQPQDVEVQIIRADGSFAIPNPLRQNLPNLNYRGNGRRSSSSGSGVGGPKPAYVPPPPAREGFTRATGGEEEDGNEFVCASCEQELQYDPDEAPPPAKKARSRKDQEEHHFWAVKDCGHVSFLLFLLHLVDQADSLLLGLLQRVFRQP